MADWKELLKMEDVDVDGAIARFANKEERFVKYLKLFLQDESFEIMNNCLAAGDVSGAFEACHSFKGVVGNLGFNTLYTTIYDVCEVLRAGKTDGVEARIDEIKDNYYTIIEIIRNNL